MNAASQLFDSSGLDKTAAPPAGTGVVALTATPAGPAAQNTGPAAQNIGPAAKITGPAAHTPRPAAQSTGPAAQSSPQLAAQHISSTGTEPASDATPSLVSDTKRGKSRQLPNCLKKPFAKYKQFHNSLSPIQKVIFYGVMLFVVSAIITLIIYFATKRDDVRKNPILLVWDENGNFPNHCVTTKDAINKVLRCHGMSDLPRLNFQSKDDITTAHMTGNKWEIIRDNMFASLLNLIDLDLSQSQIEQIRQTAFSGLRYLQNLNLSHNKVASVENGVLSGLKNLKSLYLQHNSLQRIRAADLKSLENLQVLNISYNKLRELPSNAFKSCTSLTEIWLNDNSIEQIDASVFTNQENLHIIHLERNKISQILIGTFTITKLSSKDFIGRVILAHNNIKNIVQGVFQDDAQLQELDLTGNPLHCGVVKYLPTAVEKKGYPEPCEEPSGSTAKPCQSKKCLRHYRCVESDAGAVCLCRQGYTGSNCGDDINECEESQPCENGNVCENKPGTYRCRIPNANTTAEAEEGFIAIVKENMFIVWMGVFVIILLIGFIVYRYLSDNSEIEPEDEPRDLPRVRRSRRKRSTRRSRKGRSKTKIAPNQRSTKRQKVQT